MTKQDSQNGDGAEVGTIEDRVFEGALSVVLRDLLAKAQKERVDCAMEAITLSNGETDLEAVMVVGYGSGAKALIGIGQAFLLSRGELKSMFDIAERARTQLAELTAAAEGAFDEQGQAEVDGLRALWGILQKSE